jgi:alkanesulfonate monooxygenase SsuD/methylene tetrahydromethanopterin reductase-like flavin-dependent oxidoreductase (luciferase family)
MRIGLSVEPQLGLNYAQQAAAAQAAESAGFDVFYRSDHYTSALGSALTTPTEAWAVLAGLARDTKRISLGTLVSPVTFRSAGTLAVLTGTVHVMSGGRVEIGLGAGWDADEHARLGLAFPPLGTRMAMLEEQLQVLRGIWNAPRGWGFVGDHYAVHDVCLMADEQRPRLIVGGRGGPRSLAIAAKWADEYNLLGADAERAGVVFSALDDACRSAGRSAASVQRSVSVGLLIAGEASAYRRRYAEVRDLLGHDAQADAWIDERRPFWIHGFAEDLLARVDEYRAAGCDGIIFEDFLGRDLDMIKLTGQVVRSLVSS